MSDSQIYRVFKAHFKIPASRGAKGFSGMRIDSGEVEPNGDAKEHGAHPLEADPATRLTLGGLEKPTMTVATDHEAPDFSQFHYH